MSNTITISAMINQQEWVNNNREPICNGEAITIPPKLYQKAIRLLIWKLDKRLIPFLTLLELFSFLNRVNIGIVTTLL